MCSDRWECVPQPRQYMRHFKSTPASGLNLRVVVVLRLGLMMMFITGGSEGSGNSQHVWAKMSFISGPPGGVRCIWQALWTCNSQGRRWWRAAQRESTRSCDHMYTRGTVDYADRGSSTSPSSCSLDKVRMMTSNYAKR